MPRGGRRPGAGAPKGNFNAVKSGTSSRRLRIAMATMLAVPEYRHILRFLLTGGEKAHRDVTDLLIPSARTSPSLEGRGPQALPEAGLGAPPR